MYRIVAYYGISIDEMLEIMPKLAWKTMRVHFDY